MTGWPGGELTRKDTTREGDWRNTFPAGLSRVTVGGITFRSWAVFELLCSDKRAGSLEPPGLSACSRMVVSRSDSWTLQV